MKKNLSICGFAGIFTILWLLGCSGVAGSAETAVSQSANHEADAGMLALPQLAAVNLGNRPLQVIASTSLIGDVVEQVGGEAIALTTLMAAGQDPHSYEPGARELTAVAQADVIFINGWKLEEALAKNLGTIGEGVPIVSISANIEPLMLNEADHEPSGADPHVWFDVKNVIRWTENVVQILTELDPANATIYSNNAEAYLAELASLENDISEQVATLPKEKRVLVTNHDSFNYFAQAYGFEILGTVLPGSSTIAEPSARDLRDLIEAMETRGVCTIFTETAVSDTLSQTVAAELTNCNTVNVIVLYIDAIGPAGSGADSYIGMFRANVAAIVAGLK